MVTKHVITNQTWIRRDDLTVITKDTDASGTLIHFWVARCLCTGSFHSTLRKQDMLQWLRLKCCWQFEQLASDGLSVSGGDKMSCLVSDRMNATGATNPFCSVIFDGKQNAVKLSPSFSEYASITEIRQLFQEHYCIS
jgi:hypothetical protein